MTGFDATSASRAVLIEVMNVLGAFRDDIVLVGGGVPELLYPGSPRTAVFKDHQMSGRQFGW